MGATRVWPKLPFSFVQATTRDAQDTPCCILTMFICHATSCFSCRYEGRAVAMERHVSGFRSIGAQGACFLSFQIAFVV